ncbi:hypothetical protein DE146DRAFT_281484 [Phaeosphaeria sp. MPI-PUGE-AT-0046c]|nr:hypothetical protein DE146DRAFT_281484 [Phaeosphaeria sp. MPI-PUGE-AT-0046c]
MQLQRWNQQSLCTVNNYASSEFVCPGRTCESYFICTMMYLHIHNAYACTDGHIYGSTRLWGTLVVRHLHAPFDWFSLNGGIAIHRRNYQASWWCTAVVSGAPTTAIGRALGRSTLRHSRVHEQYRMQRNRKGTVSLCLSIDHAARLFSAIKIRTLCAMGGGTAHLESLARDIAMSRPDMGYNYEVTATELVVNTGSKISRPRLAAPISASGTAAAELFPPASFSNAGKGTQDPSFIASRSDWLD